MFTKKKIIAFLAALAVFLAADLWMFSALKGSFAKTLGESQRQLATAVASSAPAEAEAVPAWLQAAGTSYPGVGLLYLRGLPGIDAEVAEYGRDEALVALYREAAASPGFAKGIESASYLETYLSTESYQVGATRARLLFAPVYNETRDMATGLVIVALDDSKLASFAGLADSLAIVAFALFALAFGVATFSRDPLTGYAILGLFGIAAAFVAYPLFQALKLTFLRDGRFSLSVWGQVLGNKQYLQALWGSVKLGCLTATYSTVIGFLFAFAVSRTTIKGKKLLTALATMPVISPPFSLTLSIILLFGNNGLVTKRLLNLEGFSIYGLGGLSLVQTISMFPIAFLTLSGVLQAIDSTLEEASLDLNASRWGTFKRVTMPLAAPGLLSAWLLVFTNSLADFANPLLLAGSYRVLSVESYIEVTGMNRLANGSALSILLLLPTLTAFFIQRSWVSKRSFVVVTGKPSGRLSDLASPGVRRALAGFIILVSVFIVSLYGTIVAGCFVKNWGIDYSFTLSNIGEALTRGKDALVSTLVLAGVATPIAGILSMIAAVLVVRKKFPGKRLLEALVMTPFAIPGTLVGISYILAFNQPPILLVGTGAILVICYVVRELPVGLEGGVATLRQIDPSIEEAASDLGADQATIFRTVVLPLIRPAFISSMSYTFVRSMTAVSAIIFLISARWYHITIQIYNFSENIRFGLASVLSTTLIVIVLAVFGLMRLLVRQSENLEKTVSVQ
ncbi:MAG: iron ABC transporter permease [Spirochaetaceae bacterium]|nr:iron ABC transporter permease [Spirochaetaceae bacterium]